ncbi:peptidoglycan/LPS O-acetylase OafA/YrhL [Aquabacterium commune]|uniref:Peptidoglycan/LPS O-acetylase OafA/YrhL n=1 Tax=Aquabacterium commune TaxID=70586 RepID=A0A4R6RPF8_9BURK|nr:acyltransferase [Aquabacterium commune]TDP88522.1 peptidoglycan/LPS O-acetylase OafA/YrhL [Aquabacterium commune]
MSGENAKLAYLDALRAGLAMWVFLGHLSGFCDWHVPVLATPGSAVDCFMLVSGFLMVYTTRKTLGAASTVRNAWIFYLGRFFRIAPLYYLTLLACAPVAAEWDQLRTQWHQALHGPHAVAYEEMTGLASWPGVVAHLTFAFGLIPSLVNSVPLPDWSLSLEMQFYLLFPLMAPWAWQHPVGRVALVVTSAVLSWVVPAYFGRYAEPGAWYHFVQPSMILFKLNVFVAGMLVAAWHVRGARWDGAALSTVVLVAVSLLTSRPQVWMFLALFMYLLSSPNSKLAAFFSRRVFGKLGDWSYGIYLVHIFLVFPVLWWLEQHWRLSAFSPAQRFAIAAPVCTVIVLAVSAFLHRTVEMPGVKFGRRFMPRR